EKAKADSARMADSTKQAQQAAMMKVKQDSAAKAAAKADTTKKDTAKKM
ncbi:MAG: protein TolA, partial [Bacteroidia bacterium]|nr:protein TolA [Bacteroidia bacterium]